MTLPEPIRFPSEPEVDAAVTVKPSPVGVHVGLLYLSDDGGLYKHLHLAWHHDLRNDAEIPLDSAWIPPALSSVALEAVAIFARLVAQRHEDGRVPYAFRVGACFDPTGRIELNGALGLTCATFVLAVFDGAGISLLDVDSWTARTPERVADDVEKQEQLVTHLRKIPGGAEHAELVAAEVGCTRIRAEEVAAGSQLRAPAPFAHAAPWGARIRSWVEANLG